MKPRHAAALALVGWYLMIPPVGDTSTPLARWVHVGSYDTATECETTRLKLANDTLKGTPAPNGLTRTQTIDLATDSQCIETDDPRLAK